MTTVETVEAAIGHNLPPADLLVGDALREKLVEEHAALLNRTAALLEAGPRVPEITDDDLAAKAADFVKQITAAMKAGEGARVAAKEPYLEGGRVIDGFFKKRIDEPLLSLKAFVSQKITVHLRAKADRERRDREERERLARVAAEAARREAEERERALRDEASLKAAIEANKAAERAEADAVHAEKDAKAKPADLSRMRGEMGAVTSLVERWEFADLDRATLDLETLREHIPLDGLEKAVRSFIKAGGRELDGVRIFLSEKARVV
jgi:hypothetical protein